MKILLLTEWFDPEPTFKGLLFARELAARGHQVEVLTGFPNYPGGKLYPGYSIRPWRREMMDGIPVLRVALYPSHDTSPPRRILTYASFALSAAFLGTLLVRKPDLIYVYHPPGSIGFSALVISALRRAPFVYDVQDLWPDTLQATGMVSNRLALRLVGMFCNFVYRRAARINVLSPGFRARLVERGVPAEKIEVVYNWCDESAMRAAGTAPQVFAPGRFSVLFAGTMGLAQDLDSVLGAAQICRTSAPAVDFIFVGGGVDRERLMAQAAQMELGNVRFLPPQPFQAMGPILAAADVLLVHLKDDPLFRITIPSKTQAYLAVGKPVLMAVVGDAADLVTASGGGIACRPGDAEGIATTVKQLIAAGPERLAEMGSRGRQFYERELSVATGVTRFEQVFEGAVHDKHGRRAVPQRGIRGASKSVCDRLAATLLLVLLSPLLFVIAVLVRLKMGSPVMFRQPRPGRDGKIFELLKFRTMTDERDADGNLLPDEARLTPLGRRLRSLSLDELPQLWNVLRGELSFVGPRPLLVRYLDRYTPEQARRHLVKPGITGWAQVNGRNALRWEKKFAFDTWYVDHWGLWLDFRILLITVWHVLRRQGISSDDHATMPEFFGSKEARR